jgi:enoyl-CoA hydratase/3-hydroxyacyl-CoA dehydrogenase
LNEGFWAVYNNEVTKEEVDVVVRSSGFPMGIFELADLIGLDQLIMGMKVIEQAYGKRAKVCPIIEDYVKQNKFGVKSGEGFYDYRSGKPKIRYNGVPRFDINRVYAVTANEAAMLIQEDVATVQDIDIAMRLGFNWSLGPCERADDVGIDIIVSTLKSLYAKYGWERYSVAPLLQDYVKAGKLGRRTGSGFYVRNT